MEKILGICRRMRENNVWELRQTKQISLLYSFLQTLKYHYFQQKNIYIGSRTIIMNPGNIEINEGGRLEIAFGDFGLTTKTMLTCLKLGQGSKMLIEGAACIGRGCNIGLGKGANLKIGGGTFITGNTNIICHQNIVIGENCAISWGVQLLDNDFHRIKRPKGEAKDEPRGIIIGEHVWIGSNVTVLKNVKIGDGCIVGANTVVTKSVPPRCMVAGNPARVIRENVEWE